MHALITNLQEQEVEFNYLRLLLAYDGEKQYSFFLHICLSRKINKLTLLK